MASQREMAARPPGAVHASSYISVTEASKEFTRYDEGFITRRVRSRTVVFQNLEISVAPRQFVSIVGPSGCGKTTLLRCMAGLERLTRGEIIIGDQVINGPRPGSAFIFQSVAIFPWLTVRQNVAAGLTMRGSRRLPSEARERVEQWIETVGLAGFAESYPRQLSGGMQQRVGIARALVSNPDVLLMDEPFGALDAQTRMVLQEELIRLFESLECAAVFVTHDIDEALTLSDRILVMSRRPSVVLSDITVPWERPRDLDEVRKTPEFASLRERIWTELRPALGV
jgi:NitT/TauT family transport system ATP-binding protein